MILCDYDFGFFLERSNLVLRDIGYLASNSVYFYFCYLVDSKYNYVSLYAL